MLCVAYKPIPVAPPDHIENTNEIQDTSGARRRSAQPESREMAELLDLPPHNVVRVHL